MNDNSDPIFPNPEAGIRDFDDPLAYRGMSLRDWFAGMAMQGGLAGESNDTGSFGSNAKLATWAYGVADAMLKEREQQELNHE